MAQTLIATRHLTKYFPAARHRVFSTKDASVRAVDGVSFSINRGETLGLVGESGCGKSTTGRLMLRLLRPTSGTVHFEGRNIFELGKREMHQVRQDMQIIFQDPFASLNPRLTVREIIGEPLEVHRLALGKQQTSRVEELLNVVGLSAYHANRYPHEFSGGQRQRIGIARALAVNPKLIVCDEPVSALDVSIRAQIINLLQDLQERFGLTYLFIAHDLSVVEHISDRVAVMYLGRIVEMADKEDLFGNPRHPYTQALLSTVPVPDPTRRGQNAILGGEVPSPLMPPTGCAFHPRCPYCRPDCSVPGNRPEEQEVTPGHFVACNYPLAGNDMWDNCQPRKEPS